MAFGYCVSDRINSLTVKYRPICGGIFVFDADLK